MCAFAKSVTHLLVHLLPVLVTTDGFETYQEFRTKYKVCREQETMAVFLTVHLLQRDGFGIIFVHGCTVSSSRDVLFLFGGILVLKYIKMKQSSFIVIRTEFR